MVADTNEASIGLSNGERVEILWNETSLVPRKHRAGGQSAKRFEGDRRRAKKEWIHKIADKIFALYDGREVIIGGPGMFKDELAKNLHSYITVSEIKNADYTNENGLYGLIGISRYI